PAGDVLQAAPRASAAALQPAPDPDEVAPLREEVRAVPGLRQPAVEYVPADRQGIGESERAHEQLHGAVAVVFVYLRVEGGVHPVSLARAELALALGEHDAVEADTALHEPELQVPPAAYGRDAVEQGVRDAEGRPGVAAAVGLELLQRLDAG